MSLSRGSLHGYRIRKELLELSGGAVRLDPGTLYRLIARLLDDGLICDDPTAGDAADERRKYYRLTTRGEQVFDAEIKRMDALVRTARSEDSWHRA